MEKDPIIEKKLTSEREIEDLELDSPEEKKRKIQIYFLEACKRGKLEVLLKIINDEALNILELYENNWTGLQWAVVNGHEEIVKILYPKEVELANARQCSEDTKSGDIRDYKRNEFEVKFKKPIDPADKGKYSPLHWAAYKGNNLISSILLKMKCNPLDPDKYGNNALHQAAASNKLDTFKLFMGQGIDLDLKNSRSHVPYDLTSNKEIQHLIVNTLKEKACKLCNVQFNFFIKRYLCAIKEEVVCKNCCVEVYYYPHAKAKEKDLLDCRCKNCDQEIIEVETNLLNALNSNKLADLVEQINISKNYKICQKLAARAYENQDRLIREKEIIEHLNDLKTVTSHKTIEKSVFQLEEMIRVAQENHIEIDFVVLEKAYLERNRLLAEKELRKLLTNLEVHMSSHEVLDILNEKIENAKKCMVEMCYIDTGIALSQKIQLNLKAKELLTMFTAYPIREYPKIEADDPKNRKKKQPPPPKKRKKKEPPFLIPEWAKELKVLIEKVQELKGYLAMSGDIGLGDEFLQKSKEQLSRFAQEIAFRRNEEETLRKLEEEKKKKAKKKK